MPRCGALTHLLVRGDTNQGSNNEVLIDVNSGYAANGSVVNVKIDRAEDFDLYGQIVK